MPCRRHDFIKVSRFGKLEATVASKQYVKSPPYLRDQMSKGRPPEHQHYLSRRYWVHVPEVACLRWQVHLCRHATTRP